MSEPQGTALVVLTPGPSADPDDPRAGEVSPHPDDAERVVAWFAAAGFECGPVVGISFSITGPVALFESALGGPPSAGTSFDLPAGQLGDDVAPLVQVVSVGSPPDFGPGNP